MDQTNVADVTGLAKAISEYGVMAVILAVFLIIFIAVIFAILKFAQKQMSNMIEQAKKTESSLKDQQQAILNGMLEQQKELLNSITKQVSSNTTYDERNIVEVFYKLNTALKSPCKEYQGMTGADRISIYVFHNGTSSSHGLPFFKMTCISEFIRRGSGLISLAMDHNNLPLNMFDTIVNNLYTDGKNIVSNKTDTKNTDPIMFVFSGPKINTCIMESIFDSDNRILGFVCAEYKDALDIQEISNVERSLIELCIKVKPVLEFSKIQEYTSRGGKQQ